MRIRTVFILSLTINHQNDHQKCKYSKQTKQILVIITLKTYHNFNTCVHCFQMNFLYWMNVFDSAVSSSLSLSICLMLKECVQIGTLISQTLAWLLTAMLTATFITPCVFSLCVCWCGLIYRLVIVPDFFFHGVAAVEGRAEETGLIITQAYSQHNLVRVFMLAPITAICPNNNNTTVLSLGPLRYV